MKSFELHENIAVEPALAVTAQTAGAESKITGETIDLKDCHDLTVVFDGSATLDAAEGLDLAALELQESDDGATWDTAEDLVTAGGAGSTRIAYSAGAATVQFSAKVKVDLAKAKKRKRYIRLNPTFDLSRGATDTLSVSGVAIKGGLREVKNTQAAGGGAVVSTDILLD